MVKKINLPFTDNIIETLKSGDTVLLSGDVITARDMAHMRFYKLLEQGKSLPVDIKNETIYYVGATPARPGNACGSAGPTSSRRMDAFTPALLDLGLKGMIGKGKRSQEVINSMIKNKCVYLCAIGGAGALISKSVVKVTPICYEDLGTEGVYRFTLKDFPCIVGIDCKGNSVL